MAATRNGTSFPNLTPDLIKAVEDWASKSDDELLEAMRDTSVLVLLSESRGWRQDSRGPAPKPTHKAVQAEVEALKGEGLLEKVCNAYCATRERFSGDSIYMACALLDAFIGFQAHTALPLASVAVYAARNGIMDNVCKCPKPSW
jgi:hypothetical protein